MENVGFSPLSKDLSIQSGSPWWHLHNLQITSAGSMLGQCLRRWPSIEPALGQFLSLLGSRNPLSLYRHRASAGVSGSSGCDSGDLPGLEHLCIIEQMGWSAGIRVPPFTHDCCLDLSRLIREDMCCAGVPTLNLGRVIQVVPVFVRDRRSAGRIRGRGIK